METGLTNGGDPMYWDERGWYITEEDLKDEYKTLKANGETEAKTYKSYVANCTSKNGTLTRCENMFCHYCIDAIRSRGEKVWTVDEYIEGRCDWCEEEDEVCWARF